MKPIVIWIPKLTLRTIFFGAAPSRTWLSIDHFIPRRSPCGVHCQQRASSVHFSLKKMRRPFPSTQSGTFRFSKSSLMNLKPDSQLHGSGTGFSRMVHRPTHRERALNGSRRPSGRSWSVTRLRFPGRIYVNNPKTLEELKNNIKDVIGGIERKTLEKFMSNFAFRLKNVRDRKGSHIEHLL